MVYSSLAQVKRSLGIPTSNVVYDAEIADAQTKATREIDTMLENNGIVAPLTVTKDTERASEVEADCAAAIIQENKGESNPAKIMRMRCEKALMELIKSKTGGTYTSKGGIMEKGLHTRTRA